MFYFSTFLGWILFKGTVLLGCVVTIALEKVSSPFKKLKIKLGLSGKFRTRKKIQSPLPTNVTHKKCKLEDADGIADISL